MIVCTWFSAAAFFFLPKKKLRFSWVTLVRNIFVTVAILTFAVALPVIWLCCFYILTCLSLNSGAHVPHYDRILF